MPRAGPPCAKLADRALEGPGRLILARFNMPEAEGPLPAFVLLHGGGWTWNTIYTGDRTAREYAARAGAAVIAPDYSLSPEYKFPQALRRMRGGAQGGAGQSGGMGHRPRPDRGRRGFGRRQSSARRSPRASATRARTGCAARS